jgi:hypothetical protein
MYVELVCLVGIGLQLSFDANYKIAPHLVPPSNLKFKIFFLAIKFCGEFWRYIAKGLY